MPEASLALLVLVAALLRSFAFTKWLSGSACVIAPASNSCTHQFPLLPLRTESVFRSAFYLGP
ncbi:MAG: hypothetical protein NTU41_03395, partial [Chloroflexi bacterium]|nr:hypothetical protein [Chloroflexota bacterium]